MATHSMPITDGYRQRENEVQPPGQHCPAPCLTRACCSGLNQAVRLRRRSCTSLMLSLVRTCSDSSATPWPPAPRRVRSSSREISAGGWRGWRSSLLLRRRLLAGVPAGMSIHVVGKAQVVRLVHCTARSAGRRNTEGTLQAAGWSRGLVAGAEAPLCQRRGMVTVVWYGDKQHKAVFNRNSSKPASNILRE